MILRVFLMVNQNMNFLWQVTSIFFFFCITCMTTSTGEETLNQSWLACLYLCHFALFKMNSTCFNTIIHNTLACIQYSIIASGLFSDFKIKCFLKKWTGLVNLERNLVYWSHCLPVNWCSNIDLTSLWFKNNITLKTNAMQKV